MEIILQIPPKLVNVVAWRNNNLSLINTEPPLSEQGETLVGAYLLILGWLSWFGNSLVIFVLYRQRASLQPTDLLTLNLAISDASISVFGYSRGIVEIFNVFRDDGFLITSIWTCQVDGFFTLLFGLTSINTLTVISVTRYIKGCHPNRASCVSTSTVSISLMFIWTASLFWSVAPLLGWGSYTDRGYGTCDLDWSRAYFSTIYKSYILSLLVSCFLIPVLIMLFSYVSIINTVKSSNAMAAHSYLSSRQRKVERDVTRVSVVICTAFITAWSPYAAVSLWSALGFHVPNSTSLLTRLLAKSTSFYNPLVYVGMSSKFRQDATALLPCPAAGNAKDTVRLRHFKDLEPKPEAAALPGASLPVRQPENKYAAPVAAGELAGPAPDRDSGVISPPHTPPPSDQQVVLAPVPEPSDTPEWQSDRL